MSQPKLSLCMIIRDEQAMLPDFLESVAELWDELIVVDTGSIDDSISLVEAAGAQVFHFTWIDDFSAARNKSLEAATGQWILFLDADERPSTQLVHEIRALMDDPAAGAATIIMRNQWPDGSRRDAPLLRVFRNHPSIRFEHVIHEDISTGVRDFLKDSNLVLRHLKGVVHHLGYARNVANSRDKKSRDLELLNRSLENDPDDFYCWYKILEIARFWNDQPLWEKTASKVSGLLNQVSAQIKSDLKQRPFSGEFAALVAQGLPGDDKTRLHWLDNTIDFASPSGAWHLRRGLILESLEINDQATKSFENCLNLNNTITNQDVSVRALLGLCRLSVFNKNHQDASQYIMKACAMAPRDPEALLAAVTILPLLEATDQPTSFISGHLKKYPEASLDLSRALMSTGQIEFTEKILSPLASQDADAALGYLVCCLVMDKDLDLQVDVDQETADRLFQDWIHQLWLSRNTNAMEAFANGCGSVLGIFPWLPEFLKKETRTAQ